MMKLVSYRTENVVGKGESVGYQHFLLFPQCFHKASFSRSLKVGMLCKRVKWWELSLKKEEIYSEDGGKSEQSILSFSLNGFKILRQG